MSVRPRPALRNPELQRPNALAAVPRDTGSLWLDKNENFDPDLLEISRRVLLQIPAMALASYPESGELYRKLAHWVGVSGEQLLLTPGSDGAIRAAFEAFVEEGDAVVHTLPTFAMYPVYCQIFGAVAHVEQYRAGESGPVLDTASMIATIEAHRPKLVCIPNPDSPTGTVLTTEELQQILSACETVGSVLLLDEAYHPFYKPSAVSCTVSSPNLVVARTFAKAWGAAGLRIGYAVAHPETAAFLHKIRPMYEVSTLAVEFMTRMLDHEADMLAAVDRLNNGKAWFIAQMRGLGYRTLPTEANYVHVDFGAARSAVQRALSGKVLYRASFDHPCLAGFSRFTVGPQGTMERVVELIRGV